MRRHPRLILILIAALAVNHLAWADAIITVRAMSATTIMEAFVEEGSVRLEIEMGLPDAPAFVNILPQEIYDKLDQPPATASARQDRFFTEDLVISADGEPLPGRVVSVEARPRVVRDEISGEPRPVAEDQVEPVLFYVLEYPLARTPATISFKLPDAQTPGAAANIGFILYHRGVAVNDFRYLTTGATVDLDWDDPWHSRFRARGLRRAYEAPMNVFLYVEHYEVRVEIIIRPLDAQRWIDLGLAGRDTITPDMYEAVQAGVLELLATHLHLTIDGVAVEATPERINFLRRTLRSSTVIDPPETLSVYTAQLGAIFVVPRDGLPEEAAVTWDLFASTTSSISAAATDEAGPLPATLTETDNVLTWRNFLKNPTIPTMLAVTAPPPRYTRWLTAAGWLGIGGFAVLAIWGIAGFARTRSVPVTRLAIAAVLALGGGLALAGHRRMMPDETRATAVVGSLLHNVYRAFDRREEGVIHDALARSVAGDLLTQTYLETQRSLELRNQGGARVRVSDVEVVHCRPGRSQEDAGFTAECRWNVAGSVGHWGHIHQRQNQYDALLTVRPIDGQWKITGMELQREERM